MTFLRTLFLTMSILTVAGTASAQQAQRPNPLDARGGMPIPENLYDLKNLSLDFWLKFRRTNQRLYNYVNEAAVFHAYLFVCKRHDLNVQMAPITRLSHKFLQAAIPAHYEEPEFELLEKLSKEEQQAFLDDMSSDLYSFEFGMRVAQQDERVKQSGKTAKIFCEEIQNDYYKSYIALLATARRELDD